MGRLVTDGLCLYRDGNQQQRKLTHLAEPYPRFAGEHSVCYRTHEPAWRTAIEEPQIIPSQQLAKLSGSRQIGGSITRFGPTEHANFVSSKDIF